MISITGYFIMAKLATSLLFLILTVVSTLTNPSQSAATAGSIEFIRTSCSSTVYPNLCFTSLSPYASSIGRSPLKLPQVATFLTLSRVPSVTSHVSSLSLIFIIYDDKLSARRPNGTKALKDCSQVLGIAADRTQDSMAELKKLKKGANETESRWCLLNVMTWMSAALANEETCTDGLKEAKGSGGSAVAVDVGGRIGVVKEYTSNALALVNKLSNH